MHLKFDTALVGMRAGELPASWSSGELHQLARFLTEFGRNDIITFLGPLVRMSNA